jgi:hypothetical protein
MAQAHDTKYRAKSAMLKPGDFVRIKHPVKDNKLSPSFSEPIEVRWSNGRTVWLRNGQRWNARRCVLHGPNSNDAQEEYAEYPVPSDSPEAIHQPVLGEIRRSQRAKKKKTFGPDFL